MNSFKLNGRNLEILIRCGEFAVPLEMFGEALVFERAKRYETEPETLVMTIIPHDKFTPIQAVAAKAGRSTSAAKKKSSVKNGGSGGRPIRLEDKLKSLGEDQFKCWWSALDSAHKRKIAKQNGLPAGVHSCSVVLAMSKSRLYRGVAFLGHKG